MDVRVEDGQRLRRQRRWREQRDQQRYNASEVKARAPIDSRNGVR